MTRTLTILAAIATLAVSAQAASAGTSTKPPTQTLTYTLNNTMISGYSAQRATDERDHHEGRRHLRSDPPHGLLSRHSLSAPGAVNPKRRAFTASVASTRRGRTGSCACEPPYAGSTKPMRSYIAASVGADASRAFPAPSASIRDSSAGSPRSSA